MLSRSWRDWYVRMRSTLRCNKGKGYSNLAAEHKVEARSRRWLIPVALVLLQEENSYG